MSLIKGANFPITAENKTGEQFKRGRDYVMEPPMKREEEQAVLIKSGRRGYGRESGRAIS